MATLKDKQFLAETENAARDQPGFGHKAQEMVAEVYETPKPVAEKVAAMLRRQD